MSIHAETGFSRPPEYNAPEERGELDTWSRGYNWQDRVQPNSSPDFLDEQGKTAAVEVREAGEMGKGIYARKDFTVDQPIFEFDGEKQPEGAAYWARADVQALGRPNAIVVGREHILPSGKQHGRFVWAEPGNTPLRYLNHSCEPNVYQSPEDPFQFRAEKNIVKGEQLTTDYSFLETSENWQMECKCGSRNCRKTIGGILGLPAEYIAARWDSLPAYLQQLVAEKHADKRIENYRERAGVLQTVKDFHALMSGSAAKAA